MNTPRTWVRVGLVGVLSLLGLAFSLSEAQSQFPRPPVTQPRPPIIPPRPPITMPPPPVMGISGIGGRPGGISGISGMPGGISGGISGISGMPGGISGIGGGIGGGGIGGGIGGFTMTETVWTCSGCKAELGRGPVKPSYSTCPRCQARFSNGGPGGFTMISPPPPTMPTPPPAPVPEEPQFTLPGFSSPPTTPTAGPASSTDTTGSTGMKWKVVGLVVVALAIIAATGGALVWNANRSRELQRRRRYVD